MSEKKILTIKHFSIFNTVFECESVTKASVKLHIPQPSVSRALREIEDSYNIRLFERMMKKIIPTADGKKLYSQTVHLLEYYRKIDDKLFTSDKELLRIASSVRFGIELIPKLVREFKKTHPNVEIYVKITNQKVMEEKLSKNELDVAFCEGVHNSEQFISSKFAEDELTVVVPKGHELLKQEEVSLEDILNYPLLLREEGSSSRELFKNVLRANGLCGKPLWESISTEALMRAVYSGLGISILPKSMLRKNVEKGLLYTIDVKGKPFVHNLYALWHRDKYITDSMKDLIELCKSYY